MSFFYTTSAASARSRRGKDREGHPRTGSMSSGSRKHRESFKNQENKSPPPKSPVLQSTLYTQQNVALEQLPSQPSSEATSPTLSSSGMRSNLSGLDKDGVYHLSQQPYTPAALRQYLEQDPNELEETDASSSPTDHMRPPSSPCIRSRPEGPDGLESSLPLDQRLATNETPTRDDSTPLAAGQGTQGSQSVFERSDQPKHSIVADQSSVESTHGDVLYKSGHRNEVDGPNKLAGNAPGSNVRVEDFYRTIEGMQETDSAIRQSGSQTRPPAATKMLPETQEKRSAASSAQSGLSPSQRSSVLISRTFTPPAPHLPLVPSPTPPPFVSPVPLRAQPSSEQYMGYHHPSAYGVPQYVTTSKGYFPNAQNQHYRIDSGPPPYAQIPKELLQLPDFAIPASSGDAVGHRHSIAGKNGSIDETIELLRKLHEALPSIEMQLANAQRTAEFPTTKTASKAQMQDSNVMAVNERDVQIKQLLGDLEEHKKKHAIESQKLTDEIMRFERKCSNLQIDVLARKKSRDDLAEKSRSLRVEMAERTKKLEDDKAAEIKALSSRNNAIEADLQAKSRECQALREQISKLEVGHVREKEAIEANSARQMEQLQAAHQKEHRELEHSLKAEQNELAVSKRKIAQARESWEDERRRLNRKVDDEQHKVEEEQRKEKLSMEQHWQTILEAQEKSHREAMEKSKAANQASLQELQERCELIVSENKKLQEELKRMRSAWDADKSKFSKVAVDFRTAAKAKLSLQRTIEAFGEASDPGNRGDDAR